MRGNIRFILSFTVFVILAALYIFKYDGNDYSMYMNYYYSEGFNFDLGYETLAVASKKLGLKFEYFYCIYNSFNLILFGMLCKWRSDRMLIGLIPLMIFPGLPLNTIRQFTAGLICAIAYDRAYPENRKLYVILVLLACQFHISAALFLLPLAQERLRVLILLLPIAIFALAYFNSYANFLLVKISYYYDGGAKEAWYEQSIGKAIMFLVLSLLLFGGGYIWRLGEYLKYRPIIIFAVISMLASAQTSIFMRFLYLFLPAISVWMYTCSRRVKLIFFFPLWITGVINIYFVWAVWSGDAYIHRNYLLDFFK
ncbi:EpsG family protein [Pectobacterium brasiliense]|uniref:EpsG family protein n=1 Tax=Pectobacterium brasiliense TaxID=180957 RepID=UPI00057F90E4|nr:EpsG family protein [Pectobacterium brasiliense]KHT39451.1 hypothetical protein RD02_17040 [Pectobacterium brasiliense]